MADREMIPEFQNKKKSKIKINTNFKYSEDDKILYRKQTLVF